MKTLSLPRPAGQLVSLIEMKDVEFQHSGCFRMPPRFLVSAGFATRRILRKHFKLLSYYHLFQRPVPALDKFRESNL
jgi:hypothetical protein